MGLFAAAVDKGDNDDAAADGIVALYASSRAELKSALGGRRLPPPRWCLVVDLRLGLAFFFCSNAFLVLLVLVGAGVIECVGRCPCGWTGADQSSDCWRVFCLLGCSPWPFFCLVTLVCRGVPPGGAAPAGASGGEGYRLRAAGVHGVGCSGRAGGGGACWDYVPCRPPSAPPSRPTFGRCTFFFCACLSSSAVPLCARGVRCVL